MTGHAMFETIVGRGVIAVAIITLAGCGGRSTPPAPVASSAGPSAVPRGSARIASEKLMAGALAAVSRLDDFDEQRAFEQAFERLNQWSHSPAAEAPDWRVDPLVSTVREALRPDVETMLERPSFEAGSDVAFLRDRRWLADIASAARGEATDDLETARRLFEWTVQSLAITGDPPMVPTADNPGTRWLMLGEMLLSGRGSAAQRSWVFLELLRQAGIDGVMLATGDPSSGTARPWLPAAIIGGEAYLFEPTYGMPVPGTDGVGVATVRQAAADRAILDGLSVGDRGYPVKASDAGRLAVLVAAEPRSLSRRMVAFDKACRSAHGVRLAVDASGIGRRAAESLPNADAAVALWEFPWETASRRVRDPAVEATVRRELAPLAITFTEAAGPGQPVRLVRPLYTARVRDFRGDLDGPAGAKAAYLAARPSKGVIQQALQEVPPEQAASVDRLYRRMKEDATYWLGLVMLREGHAEAAIDYLQRMTLEVSPDSQWTDAARANLGRALARVGRTEEAVKVLREDGSPQRYGSRLLADRLERDAADRPPPTEEPPAPTR